MVGLSHSYKLEPSEIDVFVFRKNEDFDKQAYEKDKKQTMKIWTSSVQEICNDSGFRNHNVYVSKEVE